MNNTNDHVPGEDLAMPGSHEITDQPATAPDSDASPSDATPEPGTPDPSTPESAATEPTVDAGSGTADAHSPMQAGGDVADDAVGADAPVQAEVTDEAEATEPAEVTDEAAAAEAAELEVQPAEATDTEGEADEDVIDDDALDPDDGNEPVEADADDTEDAGQLESIADLVEHSEPALPGRISLVGVPIGNRDDITLRAIRTLQNADVVVCEEYKVAATLLRNHNISKKLIAMNEHNEEEASDEVIELLRAGRNVAVIADAGLPLVADPGSILVRKLRSYGVEPAIIPGVSSIMTGLMASGFPITTFEFAGFLPRKPEERRAAAFALASRRGTVAILETPYRLRSLLTALAEAMPARRAAIAINLTTSFEAVVRGRLDELFEKFGSRRFKGEFVLVLDQMTGPARGAQAAESPGVESGAAAAGDFGAEYETEFDPTPAEGGWYRPGPARERSDDRRGGGFGGRDRDARGGSRDRDSRGGGPRDRDSKGGAPRGGASRGGASRGGASRGGGFGGYSRGPRSDGPRSDGPRREGERREGGGFRDGGQRGGGFREGGFRDGGFRGGGFREGPRREFEPRERTERSDDRGRDGDRGFGRKPYAPRPFSERRGEERRGEERRGEGGRPDGGSRGGFGGGGGNRNDSERRGDRREGGHESGRGERSGGQWSQRRPGGEQQGRHGGGGFGGAQRGEGWSPPRRTGGPGGDRPRTARPGGERPRTDSGTGGYSQDGGRPSRPQGGRPGFGRKPFGGGPARKPFGGRPGGRSGGPAPRGRKR